MKKVQKILLKVVSYVLVAALTIGGTVAFLQDDDSDVNVMTLGNVKIEQNEYEREVDANGNYATDTIDGQTSYVLKDFTQGKPLLPSSVLVSSTPWDSTTVRMTQVGSYGGMQTFLPVTNAQDKFVTVENTGKTDAYIRTLVAIEVGSAEPSLISFSNHFTWVDNKIGVIEIDGNNYYLHEFAYVGWKDGNRHVGGILPAGDTSYPSLAQVYIKPEATNEDMVKLDGNGNGTLDILVVSQAVQTAGFADAKTALDTAFGEITDANHPWAETSFEAPAIINKVATLDNDVIIFDASELNTMDQNGFTFNGNGNTITVQDAEGKIDETGTIPLSAVVFSSERGGEAVVVNDVTVTGTLQMVTAGNYVTKPKRTDFNTTFNNVNVVDCELIYFSNNGFTSALTAYGTLAMNNCKVTGNKISASSSVDAPVYDMAAVNQTNVTIKNSEIGSMRIWNQAWVAIYDSEVDTIDSYAITTNNFGKLVIGDGAKVDTINLYDTGKYKATLTIEDGATVGTINYNDVSYTQAEWLARPSSS